MKLFAILLVVLAVIILPRPQNHSIYLPRVSNAHWSDSWERYKEQCAHGEESIVVMECQSTGLISPQSYITPILVEVSMRGAPAKSSSTDTFWVGIALNSDIAADNKYAEIAITRGIAPYHEYHDIVIAHLTTPPYSTHVFTSTEANTWHKVRIEYRNDVARYFVDDILYKTIEVYLDKTTRVELLCVAVNPGETIKGALSHCEFTEPVVRYL